MVTLTTHFAKDHDSSEVPHGDGTLADVLAAIKAIAPVVANKAISPGGTLIACCIFVNGDLVRVPEDNGMEIKKSDDIVLMPTFAGG